MEYGRSQQGAALFVALIILLIVSFMGVSAMRGSIMSERMAFNSQARELSFQAAETAINGVIAQARSNGALLNELLIAPRTHCIGATQQLTEGACGDNSTFDDRDVLRAQAESEYVRQRVAFDNDASAVVDYQFSTLGAGDYVASVNLPFVNRNRQDWRKLGPPGQFEIRDTATIGIGTESPPTGDGGNDADNGNDADGQTQD